MSAETHQADMFDIYCARGGGPFTRTLTDERDGRYTTTYITIWPGVDR